MSAFIDNRLSRTARAWRRGLPAAFVALCAFGLAAVSLAQGTNSIDGVTVSRGSSGRIVVRFQLKNPPANPPASFSIQSPPRIALDFLDTANGLGATQRAIDEAALRSLNVIQAGNRTRVVFNLNKPQAFDTQVEGNTVIVTLNEQEAIKPGMDTVQRFAEPRTGEAQHALRDVDFRRGRNGEGRLVVDLSDSSTGIDIRQQGRTLVVDFLKTSLPRNLERRIDVADFGTPVLTVDTFPQGANARMIIEPKGLWEHSAYQTDNRFILEIKPIQEDPNKLIQGSRGGYKGEKLSLNFHQALDIILQTKGLDMRKNGNVVLIAPREELALKEKQQLENAIQIGELEPLVSESFQLNYIKASDLQALISTNRQQQFGAGAGQTPTTGGQGSILSRRGVAIVDPRSNILFVQDTASRLEEVRRIIRQIDTPIRQVLIEARIVIASDRFSQQLGVRFGQQTGFTFMNGKYAAGSSGALDTVPVVHLPCTAAGCTRDTRTQTPFELASGIASAGYSDSPQLNVNLPITNAAGQLALTLINLGSGNLINLELSALEADARGKVVSSPRVVTGDNQKASIEQGTEIPYTVQGSANSPATTTFKKAVLRLEVTPQITPDGRIIMGVEVRKDTKGQDVPQAGGGTVPSIDTRSVTTQISVNNGDTAVIGGIYEETINNNVTQVPWLGNIPLLGYLFKQTGSSTEKLELLIFLTPRIVKDTVTSVR
jgi:type IV pilus assembly protein PilQ